MKTTTMKTTTMGAVLWSVGCLAMPVLACSSKEGGAKCGEGTVLKDGVCVVASASAKSAGPNGAPVSCAEFMEYIAKCDKISPADKDTLKQSMQKMEATLSSQSGAERVSSAAEFDKTCRGAMESARSLCGAGVVAAKGAGTEAARPKVAKLKDTVKFERAEWVVLSVSERGRQLESNNMFQKSLSADEGKFILVQFKIRNLTNSKSRTAPPKLRDGKGRVFEPLGESSFYVPEGKVAINFIEEIPPTLAKEFWEPYQIADDSADLQLLTHELDNAREVKPVALGL